MLNYSLNKLVSIGVTILFIAIITFSFPPPVSWSMLLVGISLVGYTHYVLGAYYQQRAWRQRATYGKYLFWFLVIVGISGLVVAAANWYQVIWLVALFTIPYFVWHGYENEHTLYTRSTGGKLSPELLSGISFVAVGLTIDAFRHSSAQFATSLMYSSVLLPSTDYVFAPLSQLLFGVGSICLVLGMGLLILSVKKEPTVIKFGWLLLAIGACGWFWYANPLPYIWLFILLLGYHFVTWGIHFGVIFWSKPTAFYGYLGAHVLVVVGVVVLSAIVSSLVPQLPLGLLNTEIFLFMTLAHIGTSFLNEAWLKQRLGL